MDPSATPLRARTDPKDIVQHLRTVHFSLLLACAGLWALIAAAGSGEYQRALDQLTGLEGAVESWRETWAEDAAASEIEQEAQRRQASGARAPADGLEPEYVSGRFRLVPHRTWTLLPLPPALLALAKDEIRGPDGDHGPLWSTFLSEELPDLHFALPRRTHYAPSVQPLTLPAPESLADIEAVWNALEFTDLTVTFADWALGDILARTSDQWDMVPYSAPVDAASVHVDLVLEPIRDADLAALWRDRIEHQFDPAYHFVGYVDRREFLVFGETDDVGAPLDIHPRTFRPAKLSMLASVDRFEFNALDAFARIHGLAPPLGSFAQTFPELSAVAAGRESLGLDKARAAIESEARRSERQITVFGLDIPAAMVSIWGAPLVVVAQFYFFLHLRSLSRALRNRREATLAPWIGVYADPVAHWTTLVSGVVLPMATAVVLALRTDAATLWLTPVIVVSILLGVATVMAFNGLWDRVRDAGPGDVAAG